MLHGRCAGWMLRAAMLFFLRFGAIESPQSLVEAARRLPPDDDTFYVEVRWSVDRLGDSFAILSTNTERVDQAEVPLRPVHILEPSTRISMNGAALLVLAPANTL
jgi:hypothetical protein